MLHEKIKSGKVHPTTWGLTFAEPRREEDEEVIGFLSTEERAAVEAVSKEHEKQLAAIEPDRYYLNHLRSWGWRADSGRTVDAEIRHLEEEKKAITEKFLIALCELLPNRQISQFGPVRKQPFGAGDWYCESRGI